MEFLPAIDLKEGKCVRLVQGDAQRKTVYSSDPVAVAESFLAAGAKWIHMVDLDGAFSGVRHHTETVKAVFQATKLKIELGGGIRTLSDAENCLNSGVERIVLGTAAWQNPSAQFSPNLLLPLLPSLCKCTCLFIKRCFFLYLMAFSLL